MIDRPSALVRCVLAALVAAMGCRSDSATAPNGQPLRIAAGANLSDTVQARPIQALIVEVRDRGSLRPHTVVRFESVPARNSGEGHVFVGNISGVQFSDFAVDTTDAQGRAKVLVVFGTMAGPARVVVTVPEFALQDTARFTVLPGSPARIALVVRDTAVYVASHYLVGAAVTDRFGNARTDALTYAAGGASSSVDASGNVTAARVGRGFVVVRAATAVDTAWVSVVPNGLLATWGFGKIGTMNLDGSDAKVLTTSSDSYVFPQWSPSSKTPRLILFYEADPSSNARISTVDPAGNRTLVIGPGAAVRAASYGRYSPDGAWIYFTGIPMNEYDFHIWRVRSDGTLPERLTPASLGGLRPSVSPDGATVVYESPSTRHLMLLDVASRVITDLNVQGQMAAFSPDGTRIAYLSGETFGSLSLSVMNRDGSQARVLTAPPGGYFELAGVGWNGDSQWILVRRQSTTFELVNATDGQIMPLRFTAGYPQASLLN